MVFQPRRRRLFRAIFVFSILTGCALLYKHWNSDLRNRSHDTHDGSSYSDITYNERKARNNDLSVVRILVVNNRQETTDQVQKKPTLPASVAPKKQNITWIRHPWTSSLRGYLHVHVWLDWCGSTVNDLRRNIHFPKYPDVRLKTKLFYLAHDAHNYGQRVFGFLHPPKTGLYTFAISSDDSSELWLSSDHDPKNSRLIAWVGNLSDPFWEGLVGDGQFTKYESQISAPIFLHQNERYFIDALHKQSISSDHLLVAWKIPRLSNFSHVTRGRISQYIDPQESQSSDVVRYARHIPLSPAVLQKPLILQKLQDKISGNDLNPRSEQPPLSIEKHLYHKDDHPTGKKDETGKEDRSPKLKIDKFAVKEPQSIAHAMYAGCKYEPSYRATFRIARYEGVYLVHETAVYPNDKTHMKHVEYYRPCYEMRSFDSHGVQLPEVDWEPAVSDDETVDDVSNIELNPDLGRINPSTKTHITEIDYKNSSQLRDNISSRYIFNKRKMLAVLNLYNENNISESRTGDRVVTTLSHGNDSRRENVAAKSSLVMRNDDMVGRGNNSERKTEYGPLLTLVKSYLSERFNIKQKTANTAKNVSKLKIMRGSNITKEQPLNKDKGQKTKVGHIGASQKHEKKKDSHYKASGIATILDGEGIRDNNIHNIGMKRVTSNDNVGKQRSNDHNHGDKRMKKNDKKHSVTRRKNIGSKKTASESRKETVVKENKGISSATTKKKIWHRRKQENEDIKYKDSRKNLSIKDKKRMSRTKSVKKNVINHKTKYDHIANQRNKQIVWHRKRGKGSNLDIIVEESSPFAATMKKLKESGQWKEIKAYAKREGLLLTKKTWTYVTWKYLRYVKPKKPHDRLTEFIYKQNPTQCRTDGNILLNEDVAKSVVNKYMKDLRKQYGREVYLKRIVNVEENHDILKGDRYLVEIDVVLNEKNDTIHISDYVFLPLGADTFCSPRDFVWRRNVTVHVIVPVKDLGKWVQHFINDMSELYETTQDPNVNVIIVDFNSSDIDIEQALKQSALKRYQLLKVNGSFQRALGVQIGADAVQNPDDIIFTCDLHLDIPNNMIEVIRKHCIQGKMAFSPMVLRLECGFTPSLPYGEWESMGYGLFAIYKSDFDRIGGMNINEFKTKWGGEDWEMVDRFLEKQMEIERLRLPNFYHYFHSKQGMWGTYGFEDNVSGDVGDNIVEDELVPVYDAGADKMMRYNFNQPLMPEY